MCRKKGICAERIGQFARGWRCAIRNRRLRSAVMVDEVGLSRESDRHSSEALDLDVGLVGLCR